MKFLKEYDPKGDFMEIHVDKDLTEYGYAGEDNDMIFEGKTNATLGKALEKIKGVADVYIALSREDKYVVNIQKGAAFAWKGISKKAIETIQKIVSPRSKKIILLPDRKTGLSTLGNILTLEDPDESRRM